MDVGTRLAEISWLKPAIASRKEPLFKTEKWLFCLEILEATPGFEPGMADLQSAALATWPRRHVLERYLNLL